MTLILRRLGCAVLVGAASAFIVNRAVDRAPTRGTCLLERTNFRDETVTLAEGIGAVAAHVAVAGYALGAPAAVANAAAGAVGLADDVLEPLLYARGARPPKGLRGHVGALSRGKLTTGNVKIMGIGAASMVLASSAANVSGERSRLLWMTDSILIAGAANLANLFDLRPGRALKVVAISQVTLGVLSVVDQAPRSAPSCGVAPRHAWLHACAKTRSTGRDAGNARDARGASVGRDIAAGQYGAILALAPGDFAARGMLGDAGANVLGAVVGTRAALSLPPRARAVAVALIIALTVASEKVSFTAVIESHPWLNAIDQWGRGA